MKRFDLTGNPHIKSAAQNGALGSAVIFDGSFGSGKKAAAAYAAAALLCRAEQGKPCGVCPSCIQAAAGSHPDIVLFNAEGDNIKIKDIRALRMQSFITPSQSPFKIFIINRADLMNTESQNALLKVLEEPLSSVFILLTENAYTLLQTVRSRCRIYAMEPIPVPEIERFLSSRLASEGKSAYSEDIKLAARECGGSIGRALMLLDKGIPKPAQLADAFASSLDGSPLKIMEACLSASSLNRSDYADFYNEVSLRMSKMALKKPSHARFYADVYDYIQQQKDKLTDNNGSVFALSSQLAAFCGITYRR
ncbi:MAG: hypothetical protein VB078_12495 [Clostridiaceae bacterium]|nr:hypothetical protein [Clostridiaceae bacterium]